LLGDGLLPPQSVRRARLDDNRRPRDKLSLLACLEVARQRRQLITLDERTPKDVGISRADAVREAGRDFWDIPEEHMPRR